MKQSHRKAILVLVALASIIAVGNIVYMAIPQNTLRSTGGVFYGVFQDINVTGSIMQGEKERLDASGNAVFSTVDTGQGANELYGMNQDLQTTDSPMFYSPDFTGTLTVDRINESTEGVGVTIEGFEIKDGGIVIPGVTDTVYQPNTNILLGKLGEKWCGWISSCDETGDGATNWTRSYGDSSSPSWDTINFLQGTGGVKIRSRDAVTTRIYTEHDTVWNLTEKVVAFDFYIDDIDAFDYSIIRFWESTLSNNTYINTATYYQTNFVTGWNTIILAKSDFKLSGGAVNWNNIKRVSFDVASNAGKNVEVTIDNIRYYNQADSGAIIISFDDGHISTWSEGYTYMRNNGLCGVASVIAGSVPDTNSETMIGLNNLKTMEGWDIVSHFYTSGTSMDDYDSVSLEVELSKSREWLINNGFTKGARFLITPNHIQTAEGLEVCKKMFEIVGTQARGYQTYPITHPHLVQRYPVQNTDDLATVKGWCDNAIKNNELVILCFHKLVENPSVSIEWAITDFQELIDHIIAEDYPVITLSDLIDP